MLAEVEQWAGFELKAESYGKYPSIKQLGSSVFAWFIEYVYVPLFYVNANGSEENGDGWIIYT